MFLHNHIASRLLELSEVTNHVGRNPKFPDLADQYCIRTGGLLERDAYPGIAILCPLQEVVSDLSDVTRLVVSEVTVRVIGQDLVQAYTLGNGAAWNSQSPKDRGQGGLDGWSDHSLGIQSCGLRRVSEDTVLPTAGDDTLLWVLEYTFSLEWHPRTVS